MNPSRRTLLAGFLSLPVASRLSRTATRVPHWTESTTVWTLGHEAIPPSLLSAAPIFVTYRMVLVTQAVEE